MKLAPTQWNGSARQLINDLLKPYFLPASTVETWQALLKRRLEEADPVFALGAFAPDQKGRWGHEKILYTKHNGRIAFGDRSPATAVFSYLLGVEGLSTEKMAALYLHLPHHSFDLDKFTRWASLTNNVLTAGWHVAHIFSGWKAEANWESLSNDELKRRTILNLHPLNLFLFPNLNKSGAVFADDPRFHALIAEAYAKTYGSLWNEFLEMAGVKADSLPAAEDFQIDLSATSTAPATVKIESKDLISKIAAKDAFDLKLITVPEAQGYHSRMIDPTLMSRGFFDIKLDYKEKSGNIRTVGFYRLNLKDLYDKKYLSRDAKGVKLMVHHVDGDSFAVGPKKTGVLAPLPN